MPTDGEIAAFEAGIKLGALYHQFVGSPVGARTAAGLEKAIEESISLQPYVRRVRVEIDQKMLKENVFGYGELEGRMIRADIEVYYRGATARARLEYDPETKYPMMRLLD